MKVLVLGSGSSGRSAKSFLESKGHNVTVFDEHIDLCVVSPGIKVTSELDLAFEAQNVDKKPHPSGTLFIKGEFSRTSESIPPFLKGVSQSDGGFSCSRSPDGGFKPKFVIGVTGTNGKTTVVNLLHALIPNSVLCGNVGTPTTSVAHEFPGRVVIVEVSSFQLEIPPRHFKPDVSLLLNITEDHLDRHGNMHEYIACKSRIAGKVNIVNRDCPIVSKMNLGHTVWFGGDTHIEQNVNAVIAACKEIGMDITQEDVMAAYKKINQEHRIEFVSRKDGISFYNDSKATNTASVLAAVKTFPNENICLLLGGVAKGQDFTSFFQTMPKNVKAVFIFGESKTQILSASFENLDVEAVICDDLKDATKKAREYAKNDNASIVLLSPGCASFDMFRDYTDRGRQFKEIVKQLLF
ncbi:MAG: UDP-N-acetylmuramoyl-L-alanine--D-glutamate ligase [Firmicutes bacterium]|nr:UDP-N-acetylmuramoyl-L-alanine--D-glutamate ligase [Bacillota bacterium]